MTTAYTILFAMCGSAYRLAFALNHLLAPRFEPLKFEEYPQGTGALACSFTGP